MYVNVRRRLVFFDKSTFNIKGLAAPHGSAVVQYDVTTGALNSVKGPQADDDVMDVTNDGHGFALCSAEWLTVRNTNRTRLTFLKDGVQIHQTDKFLVFWTRFDPSGNYALVNSPRKRPVVIEVNSGEISEQIGRDLDARRGDIDPLDGRLWAPDGGNGATDNLLLSVDCRTGEIRKVRIPLAGRATRVRFAHDGASLFVAGSNNVIICCDRDGSMMWSTSLAQYSEHTPSLILSNESGSHLCVPLSESRRSNWGENIIISATNGRVEKTIVSHKGPPARLATDWFGDHLLTHTGEIIDFFTGGVVGNAIPG